MDIAQPGYFSHPRRASRDALASGASRLASTSLVTLCSRAPFRECGRRTVSSWRLGGLCPGTRRTPASCSRPRIDDRDFNPRGRPRRLVGACIPQIDGDSDRLVQSRVLPAPTRHAPPPRCFAQLAPALRNRSNTAQSLHWPSGIVSPTERDDHLYPANGATRTTDSLFVAKRHQRSRECGWRAATYSSPNRLGLINLAGNRRRAEAAPGLARIGPIGGGEERR